MVETDHIPVLTAEVLELLDPRPGETLLDCTLGLGGHAALIGERLGPTGRIVGFDLDPANLEQAAARLASGPAEVTAIHDSFIRAPACLADLGLGADLVLADLGFSSPQMDDPARGFSFLADGPLDMRFDPAGPVTAAHLVATLSERELAELIHQYGEEPLARKIARNLVAGREVEPILTTAQLARLVREAYGARARSSRMHPATRTFMALRIAVNDELGALRSLLDLVVRSAEARDESGWLHAGARVAVISFHSLEDRLVKHAFADLDRRGLAERLTKRPRTAGEHEVQANPRARSAKLRAIRIDRSSAT